VIAQRVCEWLEPEAWEDYRFFFPEVIEALLQGSTLIEKRSCSTRGKIHNNKTEEKIPDFEME
jgi:hypothetical protein